MLNDEIFCNPCQGMVDFMKNKIFIIIMADYLCAGDYFFLNY